MKRCPQCESIFEDLYRFCDLDGTPLTEELPDGEPKSPPSWKILIIGAIAGLAAGLSLFAIYHALTAKETEDKQAINAQSHSQLTHASLPPASQLVISPGTETSPSPTTSPSPGPSPSPSANATPVPSPTVQLSSSPVSTAATADNRVRIRLQNGAMIEADEAWKGPEGIWYRNRGLVALLDPTQVKSIEHPRPAPSPAATPEQRTLQK
jgi:hypothetical protein